MDVWILVVGIGVCKRITTLKENFNCNICLTESF